MSRTYGKAQDLIDFTRSSGGTALRRVKYGAELVTNGTFDTDTTGWTAVNATLSVVSGAMQIADDGFFTAAYQAVSTKIGSVYTVSFYLADATTGIITAYGWGNTVPDGSTKYADYTTTTTDGTSRTITFNFIATSTTTYISFGCASTYSITIDNVSVKEVTFDTSDGDLILFNHPANAPRIEYDADGNLLGLLVEESRTNLIPYSEDFTQSEWVKLGAGTGSAAVVTSGFVSPSGQNNATRLQCNLNGGTSTADQSLIYAIRSGTGDYSITFWVKSNTGLNQTFLFGNVLTTSDLGVATNEWQRFTYSGNFPANTTVFIGARGDTGSDDTLDILIYGAQLEAGSFPTSYIPTSGSTATRSADVASIATSGFGYRQDEGTLYVEVRAEDTTSSTGHPFYYLKNDTSNYVRLDRYSAGFALRVRDGGTYQVQALIPDGEPNTTDLHKVSAVYKANDFAYLYNGGTVGTDTSGTVPDGITTLHLSEGDFNGHIKSIKYYPRRLTNAQLQELTS